MSNITVTEKKIPARGHTEPTYVVHVCVHVLNELKGTRSIIDNHFVMRTVILVVATPGHWLTDFSRLWCIHSFA